MDRETRRIVENYRRDEAGPLENNVIDELVGGDLDREEFLRERRCSVSAPERSARCCASSARRDLAYGGPDVAGQAGGTIRARHPRLRRVARAVSAQRGRIARLRRHSRRVPDVHQPAGQVVPWLATSWKPNADATVWTFQLRRGVRFHNGKTMTSADVVASLKHYVGKGSNAGLGAVLRRRRGLGARADTRSSFRLKSPLGAFPYLLSQTTYQAIIQPASIAGQAGHVGRERHDRHGPVQAAAVRRQAERRARPPRRLLGRPPAARRSQGHLLPGQRAAGARAAGRADRPRDAAVAAGGPAVQEQREVHVLLAADCPRTGRSACGPTRARSRMRGCAARSRSRSTGRSRSRESCSATGRSATTTRSGSGSRRPTGRSSSARRTSRSRGRCSRRRVPRT